MAESNPTRHEVQPGDAERLTRLSEEVRARLTEMAFIIARVTESDYNGGAVSKFIPREALRERAAAKQFDTMEIVEIFPGFDCCYGTIGGKSFFDCPCV